jgi:hypothetical protein
MLFWSVFVRNVRFWDQWQEPTIEAIILAVALIIEDYYTILYRDCSQ